MNAIPIISLVPWAAQLFATVVLAQPVEKSDDSIRPFHVNIPEEKLADLRRRLAATRWSEQETVGDQSQGVPLAAMEELVNYWRTDYNWRIAEAKLDSLPQFVTVIDHVEIYFIHVRSPHPNAMPLIMTHGWPGSIFELLKTIGPLTDPTVHGGKPEDAFDLVIPSMPGFGFSGKPTATGWDTEHIARAWVELMKRLGYTHYVAQGGDWGAPISVNMARLAPEGLRGVHLNYPATVPAEIDRAISNGDPAPAGLSADERSAFDSIKTFAAKGAGYRFIMGTRPQTIGYGLTDSPVGLAAWIYDYNGVEPRRLLTKDEVLDDITLYWLTNTATSSARLYWENGNKSNTSATAQKTAEISIPVAVTVFPGEIYRAPKSWTQRAYKNLIYYHQADRGGHFAAWEEPELFSAELRAAFRALR